MSNQCSASKKTTLRTTNNVCIHTHAPTRCMTLGEVLRSSISSRARYEPLNSLPTTILFNLFAGDLLSRASCFDSKSSREASFLEERTSDFQALCDPFFYSACNVTSSNFLSRKSWRLLFKIKTCCIMIDSIAIKQNLPNLSFIM